MKDQNHTKQTKPTREPKHQRDPCRGQTNSKTKGRTQNTRNKPKQTQQQEEKQLFVATMPREEKSNKKTTHRKNKSSLHIGRAGGVAKHSRAKKHAHTVITKNHTHKQTREKQQFNHNTGKHTLHRPQRMRRPTSHPMQPFTQHNTRTHTTIP